MYTYACMYDIAHASSMIRGHFESALYTAMGVASLADCFYVLDRLIPSRACFKQCVHDSPMQESPIAYILVASFAATGLMDAHPPSDFECACPMPGCTSSLLYDWRCSCSVHRTRGNLIDHEPAWELRTWLREVGHRYPCSFALLGDDTATLKRRNGPLNLRDTAGPGRHPPCP